MKKLNLSRREWITKAAQAGVATAAFNAFPAIANSAAGRVVIVGGGFGGATAARYVKRFNPDIKVTLIEPSKTFYTCPFSNMVLGGLRKMEQIAHSYDNLKAFGIEVVHDFVTAVDADKKTVRLQDKSTTPYDKLLLSPGIDFRWGAIEGYDEEASLLAPHAWKAGEQTLILRKQLEAMPDNGKFVMVVPEGAFRCPPGPYERASMVAHYLKHHKPKAKLIILDAQDNFSKQGLFEQGWNTFYSDIIERIPLSLGGKVTRIDAKALEAETEFGDIVKADVLNVIPPQQAGLIAHEAGVANETLWVPIQANTFESQLVKDIYVIGDATIAAPMPKSGFSANTQAKVAAAAIVASLAGKDATRGHFANTCYSLIAPDYGISVAGAYTTEEGKMVERSGGVSPMDADEAFRKREADYGADWYAAISLDIWGTKIQA
ncbi:MAG: FAD-dependent oxidoreductase [Alcaligenaceae bacterium]|nr:FAD-dependent oxidoreductase [Alcaligenaceae bacterium]